MGQIFVMTSTEATRSGNLILDYCLLFGNCVLVLFDSRASHSFISHDCVKKLGLLTRDLGCELIVSTQHLDMFKPILHVLDARWK